MPNENKEMDWEIQMVYIPQLGFQIAVPYSSGTQPPLNFQSDYLQFQFHTDSKVYFVSLSFVLVFGWLSFFFFFFISDFSPTIEKQKSKGIGWNVWRYLQQHLWYGSRHFETTSSKGFKLQWKSCEACPIDWWIRLVT